MAGADRLDLVWPVFVAFARVRPARHSPAAGPGGGPARAHSARVGSQRRYRGPVLLARRAPIPRVQGSAESQSRDRACTGRSHAVVRRGRRESGPCRLDLWTGFQPSLAREESALDEPVGQARDSDAESQREQSAPERGRRLARLPENAELARTRANATNTGHTRSYSIRTSHPDSSLRVTHEPPARTSRISPPVAQAARNVTPKT